MSVETLGKFDKDFVESRLLAFAEQAGIASPSMPYVVAGDALLPAAALERNPTLREKVRSYHGRLVKLLLPFEAEAVLFASNARITGLKLNGQVVSAKVFLQPKKTVALQEVRARRLATAFLNGKGATVPTMLRYDPRFPTWLIEENVPGRMVNPDQYHWFASQLLRDLYAPLAKPKPVCATFRSQEFLLTASTELEFIGRKLSLPQESRWLVSLVHGDLFRTNVLALPNGRMSIVDWEHSGIMPLGFDLGNVYSDLPALVGVLLAMLRSLDPRGLCISAELQLLVGASLRMNRVRKGRVARIAERVRWSKVSQLEAEKQADAIIQSEQRKLANLARLVPERELARLRV